MASSILSRFVEKFVSLFAPLLLILIDVHIKIGCKSVTKGGYSMLKELIYDKINGFLADGIYFMSEGTFIEDGFAEGKECCVLYESVYRGLYLAGRDIIFEQVPVFRTEPLAELINKDHPMGIGYL